MKATARGAPFSPSTDGEGRETLSRIIHSTTVASASFILLSGWMNESEASSTPNLSHEWAEGSSFRPFLKATHTYPSLSINQSFIINGEIKI